MKPTLRFYESYETLLSVTNYGKKCAWFETIIQAKITLKKQINYPSFQLCVPYSFLKTLDLYNSSAYYYTTYVILSKTKTHRKEF